MRRLNSNMPILSITFLERFAFYFFNSLMIVFLFSESKLSQDHVFNIHSTFKVLIYSLPVVMGFISDFIDRQKFLKIGLILSTVGYLLFPMLSFNYWILFFAIIILALGTTIVRPIIPIIIGDNMTQIKNNKKLFRDYIIVGLLVTLAPIIVDGINDNFQDENLKYLFGVSLILMIITLLIFKFSNLYKTGQLDQPRTISKESIIVISAIFLICYSTIILKNYFSPQLTIEMDESDLKYQDINDFLSIIFTILLLIILLIKAINIKTKTLTVLLGILTLGFSLVFITINFPELSKFDFSPDNKLLIISAIALLEILFFPIVSYLIYKFSMRYKGLLFGLYFSSIAWISILFSRLEMNKTDLIFPIILLLALGVFMIIKRQKNNISA